MQAEAASSSERLEIDASITPRFKPPAAGSPGHADGPHPRWAGFLHAMMGPQRAVIPSDRDRSSYRESITAAVAPSHHITVAAQPHRHHPPSPAPAPLRLCSGTPRRSFAQVVAGDLAAVAMSGPSRPTVPPGTSAAAPGNVAPAPGAVRPGGPPAAIAAPYLGPPGFQGWPASHGGCEEAAVERERRRLPETAAERGRRRRRDMAVDGGIVLFGSQDSSFLFWVCPSHCTLLAVAGKSL
jgi:hypothetical protein